LISISIFDFNPSWIMEKTMLANDKIFYLYFKCFVHLCDGVSLSTLHVLFCRWVGDSRWRYVIFVLLFFLLEHVFDFALAEP
jgi:hypothetical protein